MHRQKSANELLQEERDAELARKLQEELDTSSTARQVAHANYNENNNNINSLQVCNERIASPVMHGRILDVACSVCTFINSITAPEPEEEYRCSQCNSVLHVAKEYRLPFVKDDEHNDNQFFENSNNSEQYCKDMHKLKNKTEKELSNVIICRECQCLNRIPQREADAMLCGACYQKLNWTSKPIEQQPEKLTNNEALQIVSHPQALSQSEANPANLPPSSAEQREENDKKGSADNKHKTNLAEEERTVQVRCGQCGAINAVKVSTSAKSIQFLCGNCEIVNEVALGEEKNNNQSFG